MDPIICCLLGICCPPESRQERLGVLIAERYSLPRDQAATMARDLDGAFAAVRAMLAPIVTEAKKH